MESAGRRRASTGPRDGGGQSLGCATPTGQSHRMGYYRVLFSPPGTTILCYCLMRSATACKDRSFC